jgi:cytochrome c-type biogenesis protein CcmH
MKRSIGLILFALLTLFLLTGVVNAQGPVSDDEVNTVAKKLYCPVCENTPLDVCPTQACKDWREMIRQQLSDGWSEEQVLDYFEAKFGPQVLAQPPASGFSALIWLLPVLGLAGGGLFLWQLLRDWQQRPVGSSAPAVETGDSAALDVSPELLARIEREVEARF